MSLEKENNNVTEENQKQNQTPKINLSLDQINFLDIKEKITSPRSLKAIKTLGYDLNKLYFISFENYIKKHPELQKINQEFKEKRYNQFEQKRIKRINEAKNKREEIIEDEKNKKMLKSKSSSQFNISIENSIDSILKNEREKLNFLKNQQINEMINLIEFEFKVKEMKKKMKKKRNRKKKKKKKN